jgi:hypothetical protein
MKLKMKRFLKVLMLSVACLSPVTVGCNSGQSVIEPKSEEEKDLMRQMMDDANKSGEIGNEAVDD